ncbi:hypothetical protein [Acinetobacter soli]|uniref:hypothetical protein n=1 Tax=Acinetobacter soli TaxID=487316 RepID=UPI0012509C46|nr:hypothetical protein [Acinetobacter soli]
MEKYLRLLQPKTTNFDAIGGGNYGSITTQDVCIAMSYARLSPVQDNLLRLKCLGANSIENINKFAQALTPRFEKHFNAQKLDVHHHEIAIRVALIEFCKVPADYKPTCRNRAVLSGQNYLVIHRYLGKQISFVLDELSNEYALAEEKVFFQLNKTN